MTGFYVLSGLIALAFIIEPELTARILTSVSVKMQLWLINLRLKWAAWRAYRSLVKICKENGFPEPGPFVFVDLWDREG